MTPALRTSSGVASIAMCTCYTPSLWHLSSPGIITIIAMPHATGGVLIALYTEIGKDARRSNGGLFYLHAT